MANTEQRVLFLRNMPAELVREVKAVAARRGQTLTTVVAEALTRSLGRESHPESDLEPDMAWFRKHQKQLVERYRDQYIAIVDRAVVDHGPEFQDVARRVFARYGNRAIYMPRVQAGEREVRIRSPRRSKS